jgi:hypothetical protein
MTTLKEWAVPYRSTFMGTAIVEAETAEEAREKFEAAPNCDDPGQELVDWEVVGEPKEER